MYLFQRGIFKNSIFVYDKNKNLIFYAKEKASSDVISKTNILDFYIKFTKTKVSENEVSKIELSNILIFSNESKTNEQSSILFENEQSSILFENELLKIIGDVECKIKKNKFLNIGIDIENSHIEKYRIYNSVMHKNIGYIKQKQGFIRNEWIFYSINNQIIGKMNERSMIFSIINTLMSFIYSFIGIGAWLIPQTYNIISSDGMDVAKIKKQFNIFTFKYNATLNILQINPTIDQKLLISMGILIINA